MLAGSLPSTCCLNSDSVVAPWLPRRYVSVCQRNPLTSIKDSRPFFPALIGGLFIGQHEGNFSKTLLMQQGCEEK